MPGIFNIRPEETFDRNWLNRQRYNKSAPAPAAPAAPAAPVRLKQIGIIYSPVQLPIDIAADPNTNSPEGANFRDCLGKVRIVGKTYSSPADFDYCACIELAGGPPTSPYSHPEMLVKGRKVILWYGGTLKAVSAGTTSTGTGTSTSTPPTTTVTPEGSTPTHTVTTSTTGTSTPTGTPTPTGDGAEPEPDEKVGKEWYWAFNTSIIRALPTTVQHTTGDIVQMTEYDWDGTPYVYDVEFLFGATGDIYAPGTYAVERFSQAGASRLRIALGACIQRTTT